MVGMRCQVLAYDVKPKRAAYLWHSGGDGQPVAQVGHEQVGDALTFAAAADCHCITDVKLAILLNAADGCGYDRATHRRRYDNECSLHDDVQ